MSITQLTRYRVSASRGLVGLGLALFSALTFGTSGTFADSLMHTGWTPGAVVTFRITLAAVLLTPAGIVAMRGRWQSLRTALPSVLAFGFVAVAGCQLFFFTAVQHLDVGVALLLEYSGVLLVVLWLWLRRGERPRRLTVIGGLAALAGLVLVLNPAAGGGIDAVGVLWALLAGAGLATYFLLSARAGDVLPPIAFAWAAMVVGSIALIVCDVTGVVAFRTAHADIVLAHRSVSWLVPIVGLSLVATAIAYAAGIAANRRLGAKVASFVGLTEVLFAVLIAWVALGQAPGVAQVFGGLIVLAGIALVRADERPAALAAPEPPIAVPVEAAPVASVTTVVSAG